MIDVGPYKLAMVAALGAYNPRSMRYQQPPPAFMELEQVKMMSKSRLMYVYILLKIGMNDVPVKESSSKV